MTEFNPYLLLLGELFAEAIGCCNEAQIFELRGMETMRQGLNVVGDLRKALAGVMDVIVDIHPYRQRMLLPFFPAILRCHRNARTGNAFQWTDCLIPFGSLRMPSPSMLYHLAVP